jgi:hypothetical protein
MNTLKNTLIPHDEMPTVEELDNCIKLIKATIEPLFNNPEGANNEMKKVKLDNCTKLAVIKHLNPQMTEADQMAICGSCVENYQKMVWNKAMLSQKCLQKLTLLKSHL